MSYRRRRCESLLPIDAIQEFNTEQNPKAEYGWRDGSTVTVGVKSGTNSLHGTAYAFGRDARATDAANYFILGIPSPPQPWSSSARRQADALSRTSSSGLLGYEGLRTDARGCSRGHDPSDSRGTRCK